jgi:DCN1-like protein 1/2
MKAHLPTLRRKLVSDPAYFKKVYTHVFDLIKNLGAKVIGVDVGMFLPSFSFLANTDE